MVQFVLDQDIQIRREAEVQVVDQMDAVISPWQGNDPDPVALFTQVADQFAVIKVAAADRVERAVNDQADAHQRIND